MNPLKHLFVFSFYLSIGLAACAQQAGEGKGKGVDNEANRYMNRSSVDRLIDAFDAPERVEWQKPDDVIALFGDLEGKTIMDLGAGSGYFSFRLANHGAHVIAADVNDEFQESIREKLEQDDFRHLSENVELRKVPYDTPDLKKGEADGLLVVNTYHHLDDRTEYMKKALAGLKEGGKIIIVDFKTGIPFGPPESHKLSLADAVNEILKVGFSRLIIDVGLLERQYVIIGEK
jgi:SAM-dependent methyltransferase